MNLKASGRLRISVVIPHLNQPEMLGRCLASLTEGTRQPDEVIVVDNGSRDLPEATCAEHEAVLGGVMLLREPTPGPGPARNRGVAASSGDVLAFIDADCIADPSWLAAAEAALADPEAAILGGDVRIAVLNPKRLSMIEAYECEYAYRMDRYIAREGFTGTGNLVVRRTILNEIGPFRGIEVAEDRDWGQRATRSGHTIRYVANMRVYHPARASLEELKEKWKRHTAHDFEAARVDLRGRAKWVGKILLMFISPLAEIPRALSSNRIVSWRERVLILLCLVRIRSFRARVMTWLLLGADPSSLAGAWNRNRER